MMNPLKRLFPFVVLALCPVWALAADKPSKAPELPELPEALRSLEASKRNHEGTPAARLKMQDGLLVLALSTAKPLTDAEWDAVASLRPKIFAFNDQSLCDKDMDRLVALDPVSVSLRITPLTGVGAAKFGQMKNLRSLTSHHLHLATPEAKEALASHPALEDFRSAGDFCIDALAAPHLKSVELAEKAATVARIQELTRQPSLATLSLFAHNITTIDDASLATVAKIPSLQTLRLAFTVLTYDGGLKQLQALPNLKNLSLYQVDLSPEDLQKFKDTFPSVKVNFTPMSADYRAKWDAMIAKQTNPAKK